MNLYWKKMIIVILATILTLSGLILFTQINYFQFANEEKTRLNYSKAQSSPKSVTVKNEQTTYPKEMTQISDLGIRKRKYSFHPSCKCKREGPFLSELEKRIRKDKWFWMKKTRDPPLLIQDGVYIGRSTCDDYSSTLGSGQKVLSYTYYTPWNPPLHNFTLLGRPTETKTRFLDLLEPLTESMVRIYPGWRMRIYHNVTNSETQVVDRFCEIYCKYDFVDFCNTTRLPVIGNLNELFPVGRFWRFQVIGDPTVRVWGSRDVDSYLSQREKVSVDSWLQSGKQFHVMRDGPFHRSTVLAGLWGGNNYINLNLANMIKNDIFSVEPDLYKYYDQRILNSMVWPTIMSDSDVYDSYNCGFQWKFGKTRPWPTKRKGFIYVGYGPTKDFAMKALSRKRCPVKCRPVNHRDWQFC